MRSAIARVSATTMGLLAAALITGAAAASTPTFTTLYTFAAGQGGAANGPIAIGADGRLFGVTGSGGAFGRGTIFSVSTDGTYSLLHSFSTPGPTQPDGGLVIDPSGNLYGTTVGGAGTIFRRDAVSGEVTTEHGFVFAQGAPHFSTLLRTDDGTLYGASWRGGASDHGTIFRKDIGGLTVLHNFTQQSWPFAPMVRDSAGNLYGTISEGGRFARGGIFRLGADGFSLLHSFSGSDGSGPQGGLTPDGTGGFFGVTVLGGSANRGTVFRLTGSGLTTIHSFSGTDGLGPRGTLLRDAAGNLFGTSSSNGIDIAGTIFRIDTDGTFSTLYSFSDDPGGPLGPLVADSSGNLYGATGTFRGRRGTIFRLSGAGFQLSAPTPPPGPPAGVIPEPATWAMMIAGFGLVGGMMRRRGVATVSA